VSQNNTLPAFFFSLLATEYPNFIVILVDTGTEEFHEMPQFIDKFNTLAGRVFIQNGNLSQAYAKAMFPDIKQDFGYLQSDIILREMVSTNNFACEYVLFTNGDNLYAHDFFRAILPFMQEKYDMLAVEFVSHYCLVQGQIHRNGQCDAQVFTQFRTAWIDLGAAVVRVGHIRRRGVTFIRDEERHGGVNLRVADGRYFETLARAAKTKIVRRTLFFHQ